ncbi:MAG: hypothetical protein C0405_05025 [Desulfovibrio sp.]|nr:hypothetical protein [Desulfovibrio sp.]
MGLSLDMKLALTPEMRTLSLRVGLGLLVLLAALYVLVVMPMSERARINADITDTRERTQRQLALRPAWASIAGLSQNASLSAISVPNPEPVPRTRVYLMPEQIAHMARAVGLEPLEVTLNPASLGQDPSSIQAQGIFSGQMEGVRELLMGLARMPSLARMERVELRAAEGRLELFLQLRIALAN